MSDYRRWYVAGGTYFSTLVAYRRRPLFLDTRARTLLGELMRRVAGSRPLSIRGVHHKLLTGFHFGARIGFGKAMLMLGRLRT